MVRLHRHRSSSGRCRGFRQRFLLELCHLPVGFGNRAVLWQVPVYDQFHTVRSREELLLHEAHAANGKGKQRNREDDRNPTKAQRPG